MTIKKVKSGWQVDIQPGGRGKKRFRKTFEVKAEAKRYEAYINSQVAKNPDWNPKPPDERRLSELVDLWYTLHGKHLKDTGRYQILKATCRRWDDPVAIKITKASYLDYRNKRLENHFEKNVTPRTLNHELTYIRAVFNELERLDEWHHGNPLKSVRKLKIDEDELTYLTLNQIKALLREADRSRNKDLGLIIRVCLSTGGRWSEGERLRADQVKDGKITFTKTKSGKNRSIPITRDLYEQLKSGNKHGRLFQNSIYAFKEALKRAKIKLPKGQSTHVLRHTFASHFMMNGGNIITLQRILGHSSITVTMRYAHLSPDHLNDAATKNPLISISSEALLAA